jgi:hypothetical protein
MQVPRGLPVADSLLTTLHYHDETLLRNNAGSTYLSYRFRMNSCYDPDPLAGSGSMSFFNEWTSMYANYRVLKFSMTVTVANEESFPVNLVIVPSRLDYGANSSNIKYAPENPYARTRILSAMGGQDRAKFRITVDLPKFWGNRAEYNSSPTFAAGDGASPALTLYMNVGAFANNNFSAGLLTCTDLQYRVLFTQVQNVFA